MPRILIVEDDAQVGLLLRYTLEATGYEVATCGRDGFRAALADGRRPDLVLLDDLPADPALMSAGVPRPPVLLLAEPRPGPPPLARGGVDATLEKPVGFPELLARIRTLLRSASATAPLAFGDIVLDPDALRVSRGGRAVHLGPTEFRLLKMFLEAPGRVFSREEIRARIWGREAEIDERTVDVHIGRLRKALARGRSRDPVRTVRGSGYALDDPSAAEGRRRRA